jgi:hypothetical protein
MLWCRRIEKKTHLERKTETKVKNDRLWNARWEGKIGKTKIKIKMKKENILKSVKYISEKPIKSYTAIKWQRWNVWI